MDTVVGPKVAFALLSTALIYQHFSSNFHWRHEFDPSSIEFRSRSVAKHWGYIFNKPNFITAYSQNASKGSGYYLQHGDNGWSAEELDLDKRFLSTHSDGVTRCATTQYAITNYFCGDEIASGVEELHGDISQLRELISLWSSGSLMGIYGGKMVYEENPYDVEEDNPSKKYSLAEAQSRSAGGTLRHLILRGHILQDQDSVGHTYVLELTPNATVVTYQSYLDHYTLREWMEKQKKNYEMSLPAFREQLKKIELLESASKWTKEVDKIYAELYGVRLLKEADMSRWLETADLEAQSLISGTHAKKIHFSWSIACRSVFGVRGPRHERYRLLRKAADKPFLLQGEVEDGEQPESSVGVFP
ncbi:hypothetical protein CYMTET_24077 [Cymbomonas tetramitiformis]|uniref:Uncharacterized protein n=1 Tax=Cymbomonas tetramitiformis TaxID=36881 RepID=A0AAE0FXG0_9CHLO|nr:hypothetical protein CYMTET_24077 [Cymbomonas tetramitiformis]